MTISRSLPRPVMTAPTISVIGGGITGLTIAFYLLRAGMRVTVFEAQDTVGGLAGTQNYGPFYWDRFYHCILTTDSSLLSLIEDLDLTSELRWTATEVGFYSRNHLYRMTRPSDLLAFPNLSLWQKFRFAAGVFYAARILHGEGLERVPLREWVIRIFGQRVYEEMWEPLLRCKLGETRERASAAFLWATLKRLYSTRDKSPSKQEKLGYVRGGYKVVFGRLRERVESLGGEIRTGVRVRNVDGLNGGVTVNDGVNDNYYDFAVLTIPNRAIAATCSNSGRAYLDRLARVEYLGIVCVVLVLRHPLSPYYVTNITQEAPYTGVIEMTNLIDRQVETAGFSLVYLPKYTVASDPLFSMKDDEVWQHFWPAFKQMHPQITAWDIVSRLVFREHAVQPVPTLNYSEFMPPMETPIQRVYVANTSQIVNNTLNNNVMTEIARKACKRLLEEVEQDRQKNLTANGSLHTAVDEDETLSTLTEAGTE